MEVAKYFIDLLEIDPIWIIIILVAIILLCLHPWHVTEKIVTEEEDGKKISKVYRLR